MNKSENMDLIASEPLPVAHAMQDAPSPGQMLAAILEKGVTAENVAAIERMAALYERMEERNSERKFNAAFSLLQANMPQIVAESVIPSRGKYQRFEDILRDIGQLLGKHGFSLGFEQTADDKRVTVTCILRHDGGHSTRTPFSVRVSNKSDNATQDDCKASTTAKRNAMLQALNIVVRQDCLQSEDDPRNDGGYITTKQAEELAHRLQMVNGNREAFLKLAQAESFDKIYSGNYEMLDKALIKKEGGK